MIRSSSAARPGARRGFPVQGPAVPAAKREAVFTALAPLLRADILRHVEKTDREPSLAAARAAEAEQGAAAAVSESGKDGEDAGETRCCRVSPAILAEERELLRCDDEDNLFDVMFRLLDRISVTVTLLEQADAGRDVPGSFLEALGVHLREPLGGLEEALGLLALMEPIDIRAAGEAE